MEKVEKFIKVFEKQQEIGALVYKNEKKRQALESLQAAGFLITADWRSVVLALNENKKVVFGLPKEFEKEVYDLLAQIIARPGIVEIIDKTEMKKFRADFLVEEARLLLLISEENLENAEKNYQILAKVGLVERQ
ncbi:MAG: hypothetical protein NTW50_05615 [Candidatus Berkelbacteria bacterium]|nr:hypothetical protein [Candidatus Berkelbacteria bacterium]